ncbi:MAG TPA: sulfotransferase [Pyrinomonadaceae bacterium]|jgi:hypothetical protein
MQRFIILGHGRSGSTLLARSLAGHPNVRMFGELLHDEEPERERAFRAFNEGVGTRRREPRFYREGDDGAAYLRDTVFRRRRWRDVLAVGFKMFYLHARTSPRAGTAWDYLIADTDLRVVHLARANLLECWLSLQIAHVTNEWEWRKGAPGPRTHAPPLELDPAKFEAYCNQTLAHRRWAEERFRGHPTLGIEYEADVVGRFEQTVHRIHDFLEAPRGPAERLLEKQARRKPREQIVNYDEFRDYFRHTLYEGFFE